jgi:2-iminobutanoate/2-iminopropanoate deaminase
VQLTGVGCQECRDADADEMVALRQLLSTNADSQRLRRLHRLYGIEMMFSVRTLLIIVATIVSASHVSAEPLEYIGKPVRGIPVSGAVKVGKLVFVSGTPAFGESGKLAVGDFPAQMKQVMENMTRILKASGTDWSRVVKTNVLLMRAGDFNDMNQIYSTYFAEGKYPARTTMVVAGLPHPDFLLEIECEAVLE